MPNPLKLLKLKPGGFQFIQEVPIAAKPAKVWKTIMNVGKWWAFPMTGEKGKMKIEPYAGGRFYETNPNGVEALHAHISYLEPNKLVRFTGPMGASHLPITNTFIFELQPKGKGTLLRLCHRGHGMFTDGKAPKYEGGWKELLASLKKVAEK
jgi:uncharacterized protein YndB with AHSA1/START domain